MSEIGLIIKINSEAGFQYGQEIENASITQLMILNSLIDVAKKNVVSAIDEATKEQ